MSEDLSVLWFTSVETIEAATERVEWLYAHIEKHHGPEKTRELFQDTAKKMSQTRINEMKRRDLVWMYDQMPVKNVAALARRVVEKNAERSRDDQLTPGFRPSLPTVEKYLRDLLKERERI